MKYLIILFRSIFFYVVVSFFYRIMGKREIGELSIMDFIVSIFIAEMVAISIENYKQSIFVSLIPIIVLVIIQIVIAKVSLHNSYVRKVLDGEPSVIIERGIVNFKEMKKQRYNLDDLLTQLRINSIKSINEVDYAILETSGKLSIFKKDQDDLNNYPLPLIVDSRVNKKVLKALNKNEDWLYKELVNKKVNLDNIFYCFYKDNNLFLIEKDKIK